MSEEALGPSAPPIGTLAGVRILGTGSFLPDNVVTNEDLAELGCDSDWIVRRTGIRERRHAPPGMGTADLAVAAAQRALEASGTEPGEIDLLLLGTLSPDQLMPATATDVQNRLGLVCGAADVSAACSGFMYALTMAIQFVGTGCCRRVLVIGADCNSRVANPRDVKTYPLFGDGAGAVVVGPGEEDQGAIAFTLGSQGSGTDLLCRPTGGALTPFAAGLPDDGSWFMQMEGRQVFKWAVRIVEDSAKQVCEKAGVAPGDVDLWLLHQANVRIIDAAVESMGIDRGRVPIHMDRYGNTSAASIPILMDEELRGGRLKHGDTLVMSGFGAGLTWGTMAWRW